MRKGEREVKQLGKLALKLKTMGLNLESLKYGIAKLTWSTHDTSSCCICIYCMCMLKIIGKGTHGQPVISSQMTKLASQIFLVSKHSCASLISLSLPGQQCLQWESYIFGGIKLWQHWSFRDSWIVLQPALPATIHVVLALDPTTIRWEIFFSSEIVTKLWNYFLLPVFFGTVFLLLWRLPPLGWGWTFPVQQRWHGWKDHLLLQVVSRK